MDTIGERIKYLIEEKHITQGKLANILGIERQSVSSYVNNIAKPSYNFLTGVYKEFDVNLNWLITGEREMYNTTQNEQSNDAITQKVYEILRNEGVIK